MRGPLPGTVREEVQHRQDSRDSQVPTHAYLVIALRVTAPSSSDVSTPRSTPARTARVLMLRAPRDAPAAGRSGRPAFEHVHQLVDLGVGVRSSRLDPEADLALRHERVRGERDVDAVVEEEATDIADLLVACERHFDHREPGAIRGVHAETVEAVEHLRRLVPEIRPNRIPAASFTSKPAITVASDATGDGPE